MVKKGFSFHARNYEKRPSICRNSKETLDGTIQCGVIYKVHKSSPFHVRIIGNGKMAEFYKNLRFHCIYKAQKMCLLYGKLRKRYHNFIGISQKMHTIPSDLVHFVDNYSTSENSITLLEF